MFIKSLIAVLTVMGVTLAECKELLAYETFEFEVSNRKEPKGLSNETKDSSDNCQRGCPRILDPFCAVNEKHPKKWK